MNTVFISGASSGIGEALAEEFAKHNYRLVLTARNKDKLIRIKRNLEIKYQVRVIVFAADISKKEERIVLCEEMKKRRLVIDVAVNNAGIGLSGSFLEQSEEKLQEMMRLNMETLTMLTKFFWKDMKKRRKGKIINIASTGAYHPGPYTAVYYATKAYVLSFTEAAAREGKRDNVQITAVCPGAVKTQFAKCAGRRNNALADTPQKVAEHIYKKAVIGQQKTVFIGLKYCIWIRFPRRIASFLIERQQRRLLINDN